MDARVRDDSQRRSSIKRPWDEDTSLAGKSNGWHGAALPPIDAVPHHRPQVPRGAEPAPNTHTGYGREPADPGPKRPRYEWNEHTPAGEMGDLNGSKLPHPRPTHSIYNQRSPSQGPLGSPGFLPKQRVKAWGRQGGNPVRPVAPQETASLCRRCRRLLDQDSDSLGACEDCKRDPELANVTQAAAAGLTQLVETLSSGISSDQRGSIHSPDQHTTSVTDCPPISQFGLKQTLDWILGEIRHVNTLVDNLVQHVPPDVFAKPSNKFSQNGFRPREATDTMKRRVESEPDNEFRPRPDAPEPPPNPQLHGKPINREDIPSMRSQYEYHPSHAIDGPNRRNIMNPPPAPATRQLPSPPGRSLSSPTSFGFPSPSAASFGGKPQPVNLPPPSSLHQSTPSGYLPPIGSAQSPDSALKAHTAALQHEVSVQKIAYSSLQGEHDKLLAAYSRSQTRASALEKKHNVSDAEIISLTEEKLRLQSQVLDLERDVEDLTRSRDECRQSAVQEGAQYVEIVRRASQLEERTLEERKSWNILRGEMEARIAALKRGGQRKMIDSANDTPNSLDIDGTRTPASPPRDLPPVLKIEPIEPSSQAEIQAVDDSPERTGPPPATNQDSAEELHQEIRHLRSRCIEMEDALRAVKEESHSMEGIIEALGRAGKTITEKANSALEIESSSD
ncbi:hypothetical protein LSUE1_G006401 [Lachnellula suecica]|uniref:Uncharacterized protein n=1 Tax=Lachnellula suecica TaxID=602035 RepID=A0A8T9C0N7_9HELO|nr:hypothetical protein LSUE1_G006401 [Lachnellula suecica]